jgi:hypothetical protein
LSDDRRKALSYVEHIRLLCCEFEVRTNSRDVIDRLSYLTQRAEQDVPIVDRCTVIVTWTGEEFHISGDGIEDDFELSITSGLQTLYQRLNGRAIAALPDHIRINAASGISAGGSFLIMGPQHAGKTTLALSLMLEGVDITGDELVLLLGRNALAFPRKFYAKEDSLRHVPRMRHNERFTACIGNPQESRFVALDPLEFGKPWKIAPAAVSRIFYIEPNHGSRSELRRSGKVEMTRRLIPHCAPPLSGRQGWLGDLCATVDRADTFIIEFGDIDTALTATLRALGQGPERNQPSIGESVDAIR